MKYTIGLDASTSIVGMSVFDEKCDLVLLTSFKPKKNKKLNSHEMLYDKATQFIKFLKSKQISEEDIREIMIEEALISSTNTFTAALLIKMQAILFSKLKEMYPNTVIDFVTVHESRVTVLPELTLKGKLWTPVPKTIAGQKKSLHKKMLILNAVGQRYPEIKWGLNRNKTLATDNYDKADSVVIGLYSLIKANISQPVSCDLNKNIEIIENYIDYIEFSKNIKGTSTEKNAIKKAYLEEVISLKKLMNFDIYI